MYIITCVVDGTKHPTVEFDWFKGIGRHSDQSHDSTPILT